MADHLPNIPIDEIEEEIAGVAERFEPLSFHEWIGEHVRNVPWWLISLFVHVVLLFGISTVPYGRGTEQEQVIPIVATIQQLDEETLLEEEPPLEEIVTSEVVPTDTTVEVTDAPTTEIASEDAGDLMDPLGDPGNDDTDELRNISVAGVLSGAGAASSGRGVFAMRSGRGRTAGIRKHGGNKAALRAVDMALAWLARNQEPDGRWDPKKHGGKGFDDGVTGLALLAFLGAGHTDRAGKYRETVAKALEFLEKRQAPDGGWKNDSHWMYAHGICAMATSEAFAMSPRSKTKAMAQKGLDFIAKVQPAGGGFGYTGPGNDTSVAGWSIMAMKSGRMAKLDVPEEVFKKALLFLDTNTTADGWTGYRGATAGNAALTAAGGLCRLFLRVPLDNPKVVMAADHVMKRGVHAKNLYHLYYGTLLSFQMGSKSRQWKAWNPAFANALITGQDTNEGPLKGSWDPGKHNYGGHGGRPYTTAMACLCLEVYYRYLPIYTVE